MAAPRTSATKQPADSGDSKPEPAATQSPAPEPGADDKPQAPADDKPARKDSGAAQREVQHAVDVATEQGFYGVETDPTPNDHYTVAGVLDGKPTPETDPDHAESVRRDLDARSR